MPLLTTKYRGHAAVPDVILQAQEQLSSIAGEQTTDGAKGDLGAHSSLLFQQFADNHCGYAQLAMSVTGTTIASGDVVSIAFTSVSGAITSVSYTATAADAAQGTTAAKLQAVATGIVAAINASAALVTGGSAYLQTVSAPVNGAFTVQAKNLGSAYLSINAATTSTPGGAGHAVLTPNGATNPFVPQNPNLHLPTNDANVVVVTNPGIGASQFVELTGGQPVLLDPTVYNAAINQGVLFNY